MPDTSPSIRGALGMRSNGVFVPKSTKVLLAPRNISNQAVAYQQALSGTQYDAEVWSFGEPAFGFSADRIFDEERLVFDLPYRTEMFTEAISRFDIFHFQFSRSLLPVREELPMLWDLPLLQSCGKRVLMHFRGTDVRRRQAHIEREPHSYLLEGGRSVDERVIDDRVAICRTWCDRLLVSTPSLLDDVPDGEWIPHVVDPAEWSSQRSAEPEVPIVLHAPSSGAAKGSSRVDEVCSVLERERLITYRRVTGLTRDELRAEVRRADIIIDSLGIGDHGAVSVEGMAAGCVCLGHIALENRERNPGVPVVEVDPVSLESVLRELAQDPRRRAALRREGIEWVEQRHAPDVVGRRLMDVYEAPKRPQLAAGRARGYPGWAPGVTDRSGGLEADVARLEELLRQERPGSFRVRSVRSVASGWYFRGRRRAVRALGPERTRRLQTLMSKGKARLR